MWTNIAGGSIQHWLAADVAHTINEIANQWTGRGPLQFCQILHPNWRNRCKIAPLPPRLTSVNQTLKIMERGVREKERFMEKERLWREGCVAWWPRPRQLCGDLYLWLCLYDIVTIKLRYVVVLGRDVLLGSLAPTRWPLWYWFLCRSFRYPDDWEI